MALRKPPPDMSSVHLSRAHLLYQQSRYDLAVSELHQALAEDPESVQAHTLMALCQVMSNRYDDALASARTAIGLAPDYAYAHYTLSWVYDRLDRMQDAEQTINEALRLDPGNADFYGHAAALHLQRKAWQAALEMAEQGLELDPEHARCTNTRSMALTHLGREEEAGRTLDAALARDPDNAMTQANQGWRLLQKGDRDQALRHFQEALRLDPGMDWAREGIVETLKARNPIYRLLLRYFFWMGKLSNRAQWGAILGAYLLFRVLREVARDNPALEPFVLPLLICYGLFALLTWVADALFNLLLRLNRYGRLALSDEQRTASNWVGAALGVCLIPMALWGITREPLWAWGALGSLMMVIPVAGVFKARSGKARRLLTIYTLALAGMALLAFICALMGSPATVVIFAVFLIGWMVYSWTANWIISKG